MEQQKLGQQIAAKRREKHMTQTIMHPVYGAISYDESIWTGKRTLAINGKLLKKGKKNFWWYETLHKEEDLGLLYYLNKAFTILYVLIFALTLLTGFIKVMSLILCPMNVILYVLTAFMVIFSRIQDNLDFHGKPFVVFAKSYNNGVDSVIFDICMVLFVFAMAYVNMMLTGNIWGISLPHL